MEDILTTIKKKIKGKKFTDDYILGYLDAIAKMSQSLSVVQAAFAVETHQERCREWAGKPK